MTLYLIGIGLNDKKDISVKGLEIIKNCHKVFIDGYTSIIHSSIDELSSFYGKDVIVAQRDMVEKNAEAIIGGATEGDVAFLVGGDPMSATTHIDLMSRAREAGVQVEVVHNASILTAVGTVGLELYKYGKTTSIVFDDPRFPITTHYDVIKENKSRGLHTLCLLDIKTNEPSTDDLKADKAVAQEPRFMTVAEGVQSLLEIEEKRKDGVVTAHTLLVGCARLGGSAKIVSGTPDVLLSADFGGPLHCLIVPGKLHFMEEAALEQWKPE